MLNVIYAECLKDAIYAQCHFAECRYAECRYAECRYAECRGALQSAIVFEGKGIWKALY